MPDYCDHNLNTPLTSPSLSLPPEPPLYVDYIPRSVATPPPPLFVTALEFARTVEQATLQDSSHAVIEEPEIAEEDDEPIIPPAIVVSVEKSDVVGATGFSSIGDDQLQGRVVHDDIADGRAGPCPWTLRVNQADDTTPQDEFNHPISDPASTNNIPAIDDVEDSPQ
ncbi:hypothetical protein P691DRAFT_758325 [Macrolepiota fuliginosa MF-IS2]|uniref:Uncharacterized protein n=1 Tax=Macrolepiota fuliginosa MF-IS2 TaxID=1400762 RepID=A0A9P5XJC3_9AGAR|nr:hypothetical protein P691DRAFT_758325 [Macrolepiota fuliginosa MF-IS2]